MPPRPHRGIALEPEGPDPERVRVRVRKRRRRSWWRRPATAVVLGVTALLLVLGGLFVRDLVDVRESLVLARSALVEVREAAGDAQVDAAAAALERADANLAVARSRSGGALWTIAGHVPGIGGSVQVTREVVRTASALVDVAEQAVEGGQQLLAGGLDVSAQDGQLDLTPLLDARDLLASLPTDRLREARDRLAAVDVRWAPEEVLAGRDETLAVSTEALTSIDRGEALLTALPPFLGDDGPRRYFLGIQTPAELRGTGGLIGYYAVLAADAGRLMLEGSDVYDAFDDLEDQAPRTGQIGQLAGDVADGVAVSDEFANRYGHTAASAFFSNVNVDPDLPTTAEVILDLYEHRTGEQLDGVVLVDPIAIERLLVAMGDEVPVAPDAPVDLGGSLPADQFAEFAMIDVYEQFGSGRGEERKLLLRGLGDGAFARIIDGAWDGVAVSRALADAASERHLQVYSREEPEQTAFERVGVAGSLRPAEGADLLAVTANNAVGGKQDVHVGHRVTADITLADPRRSEDEQVTFERSTELRVELENPLTADAYDEYIVGNCLVGEEEGGCFDGPPAVNRTWFTIWAPGRSQLRSPTDGAGLVGLRATEFRGLAAFDRYLETPPSESGSFSVAYTGRAPASQEDGGLIYELHWWAQGKAGPTILDVKVLSPDGWRIDEATVTGGGDGTGLGAFGDGVELQVEVDGDGRAHLAGTVTADTLLRLRMIAADEG